MIGKLITVAAFAAASASAAAVGEDIAIERRADNEANVCLRPCQNGKRGGWPKFWECTCNPGFGGKCCNDCATKPVETVDIDLDEWVRSTWYVQKQQVNGYQPVDALYCVAATYGLDNAKVPFFKGTVISVNNYGNKGGVNEVVQAGTENPILCGRVTDKPGKLIVAPCFLPNAFAGDYWIAGVGKGDDGKYEWAVIVGGQPKEFGPDGKCTTKLKGINNSGLWLFSRSPEAPAEQIAAMERVLDDAGITKELLKPVVQKGCNYEGAIIKSN